jgi:tetratricopeptide (TPR) repeat protein
LLFERTGEFPEAVRLYSRIAELYPEEHDACFRQGCLRLRLADYPGSIAAFERCLALQKTPEALLNLGIARWKTGDLKGARELFRQILAIAPKSVPALRCLAAMALDGPDLKDALTLHRQLLEANGPGAELLYNTGLLLQKLGRAADAAGCYRQALDLKPGFPHALLNLGHVLMTLGKPEEAHSCWQAALQADAELAERFLV